MRGVGSSTEVKNIRLEYVQFIHCNRRGKAGYVNTDASRLVILIMGKCESYFYCFHFVVYSNLPFSAGIPCALSLIGGHLILVGYLFDSSDY